MSAHPDPSPASDYVGTVPLPESRARGVMIPALSLIFITSYAPFWIAANLSQRVSGISIGTFVAVTFLSMGVGTLFSAVQTRTALVVAPATGIATIAKLTSAKTISSGQFLWSSLIAGALAALLSRWKAGNDDTPDKPGRSVLQLFLDDVPEPVKVGIRGGIGALLATNAIEGWREHVPEPILRFVVIAFTVAVGLIMAAELWQKNLERQAVASDRLVQAGLLAARSAPFLVPIGLFVALNAFGAFHLPQPVFHLPSFAWPLGDSANPPGVVTTEYTPLVKAIVIGAFAAILLFIAVSDIPGSPYDIFEITGEERDAVCARVDRSFMVTGLTSILNSMVGLFTSVYYAENHIIIRDEKKRGAVYKPEVAYACACIYFLLGLIFLFVELPVVDLQLWLLIAVSPALFCLGIHLTTRAIHHDMERARKSAAVPAAVALVPVAFTVLLTHLVGFELALPLGIVYYTVSAKMSAGPATKAPVSLAVGAAVIAIFLAWVRLGGE